MVVGLGVVVRHREAGHLRLELPSELCHAQTAGLADASLREVEGVYRVDFDLASRRLSIRFDAHVCTVGQVARQLKELIVAVAPLLPAAPAAVIMECSESMVTKRAFKAPLPHHLDKVSTISVCGVIGKAGT